MRKISKIMGLSGAMLCSLMSLSSCNKTGFKVGLLCLHGQTSTYDNNFINAFEKACKKLDLKKSEYEIRTSVSEDYNQIKTAAKEWAEDGYSMIFADSFGHQEGMRDMAYKYPNTEFCHGTGTFSTTLKKGCTNFHNAFADIYKGRYLTGVVAGYKLSEKYENVDDNVTIGYVGAFPYAEVISGYTSFYLGVKKGFAMAHSENKTDADPNAAKNIVMKVLYTGSWYDYKSEKEAAETLISKYGCELISQHADSMGAPQACKAYGVPNVCYNITTEQATPDTYLVASKINWEPYFEQAIKSVKDKYEGKESGKEIPLDFVGEGKIGLPNENDYDEASVQLLPYGKGVSNAAQDAVKAVAAELQDKVNPLRVFDTNNFTISQDKNPSYLAFNPKKDGVPQRYGVWTKNEETQNATVTNYWADVIDEGDYIGDTDVIASEVEEGKETFYFNESGFAVEEGKPNGLRSAPYFDLIVDGVEVVK